MGPRGKKPQPLIKSVLALRIAVAAITTLSLGGMTAYAGTHVYNSSGPLVVALAADTTAVATSAIGQTRSASTVTTSVRTTTAALVTTTRQS